MINVKSILLLKRRFSLNSCRYLFILILLNSIPDHVSAQAADRVAELREQINAAHNDTTRARLYGLLSWELKFSNPAEAILLADQEISIGYQENDYLRLADGYRVKALTLVIGEELVEGMVNYDSALVYSRKAGSLYYEASCYSLIAGMYGDHGDFHRAIEFYLRGLEVAQKSGDLKMIATLSNNLAESYQSAGRNSPLAEHYFLVALNNSIQLEDWPNAAMNSANLAKEFSMNGLNKEALTELDRSIDLMNRDKTDIYYYGTTCHVLASVYLDLGDMAEAEKYALRSIEIMDSLHRPANVLRPITVLTTIYVKTKNVDKAGHFAHRLLNDALAQNAKLYIRDAYKALSDLARIDEDFKTSLFYFEQYKAWNDSVFEIGREQSISNIELQAMLQQKEIETRYETEKKARENVNLKERNQILQQEKIIAFVVCVIFIVLMVLLYVSNRKKNKINAELKKEKKKVEQQAVERGLLVHEIHHRVKNNLTMLKSMLYLQAKSLHDSDSKKILSEIQLRIQSMALVHQNLYGENKTGKLDFVPFLEEMFSEIAGTFPGQSDVHFKVTGNCDELTIATAIPLGLIMNELATNSLKYGVKNGGTICVLVRKENQQLIISHSDSGMGLTKTFNLAEGGFGFRLLHLLSRQLNATIDYRHEADQFAFVISLPL